MRDLRWIAAAVALSAAVPACSSRVPDRTRDAGGVVRDADAIDAAPLADAGPDLDGGRDGGSGDSGAIDSGAIDSGGGDSGGRDAAAGDAAAGDAGVDSGARDGGSDAGGPTRCSTPPTIGLYAADDAMAHVTVRDFLVGTGMLGAVTIGGPVTTTDVPTLAELSAFDAVFVWGSGSWDGTTFGDRLADYVDAGGGVVIAVFAQRSGSVVGVSGRMESGGYLPYVPANHGFAPLSLGTVDVPSHPIMAGVATLRGDNIAYHDGTISSSATLVASWSNGRPLAAALTLPGGRTALLGLYPVRFWDTTTAGARLMANALRWSTGCD